MHRQLVLALATVLFTGGTAVAQATAYTVAVFPSAAANPATAMPVANPVTYAMAQVACGLTPKAVEVPPVVNPTEGRFDDPANAQRDCALPLAAQLRALPVGSSYKIAFRRLDGAESSGWSPFSSAFAMAAVQTHPCDGAAPTTSTAVEGQRTLSWCWDGKDANGNDTQITAWTVTVDGVRQVLTGVTVGATANAAGRRLYSAPLTLQRGSRAVRLAGTNAIGEAPFSATFTVTVAAAAAVPSVAEIRGVQ